jgi:nitroreductase
MVFSMGSTHWKGNLMETLQAIYTRRSVRDFKTDPVSEDDLHDLLRAGMQAPSARNEQPWHFIVIDDPALLHAIPEFHPASKMLLEAPLAILVCSDRKLESKRASWLQDCSAATQNILLAAHAKGWALCGWASSRIQSGCLACRLYWRCPRISAL